MNKVLFQQKNSTNFWLSDQLLQSVFRNRVSDAGRAYQTEKLVELGARAATQMDSLSLDADKFSPQLVKRNFLGEDVDGIKFHPAYGQLFQWAVDSDMLRLKWDNSSKSKFKNELHAMGFLPFFVFSMAEGGIPCPLCMTDGAARLIDQFCSEEDKERLLPKIAASDFEDLATGAMFLTEKAGGSDVGANIVSADKRSDGLYELNGEKWFCSNVNADVIFALARTNPEIKGTRGLSLFLVEPVLPDGSKNNIPIVRLKDKLGVRSMASAECVLNGTIGKMVGAEGEGFKLMSHMVNLSRLYNSVTSVAFSRRALIEAYQFQLNRHSFGKQSIQHGLVRSKLEELCALCISDFYLTWEAVRLLDLADNGDEEAADLLRMVTPMVKRETAKNCVYLIRECMELMGGIGYIEDGIMPKLYRDSLVLPIWEGAGNIMVLDMLRASVKSNGLAVLAGRIAKNEENKDIGSLMQEFHRLKSLDEAERDVLAGSLFDELSRMFKMHLLRENLSDETRAWIAPAIAYFERRNVSTLNSGVLSLEELEKMMGWSVD